MKRFLLYGTAIASIFLAMGTAAHAQDSCYCSDGLKCIVYTPPGGTPTTYCSPSIDCGAQFSGFIPAEGPINSTLQPVSVTAQANIPEYGNVDITLNPAATAGPTTLVSNLATQRFPLTADIRFQATATLEFYPGATYETAQEFHYSSSDVNSVDPFEGEEFTLVNDVTFVKTANSPATAPNSFTVKGGTSNFTLGDPPPPPPPLPPCICIGGQKCIEVPPNPPECSPAIECLGELSGTIPQTGPINASLTANNITASVTVPALGKVDVKLDATRTSSPTTIITKETSPRFPADVVISFFATAKPEAGGGEYRSVSELRYTGTVNSVNPFVQETLTLEHDVIFEETNGGSRIFILKAGESRVKF